VVHSCRAAGARVHLRYECGKRLTREERADCIGYDDNFYEYQLGPLCTKDLHELIEVHAERYEGYDYAACDPIILDLNSPIVAVVVLRSKTDERTYSFGYCVLSEGVRAA
jgi:hypothetical protein